jgi:hypothetical protein
MLDSSLAPILSELWLERLPCTVAYRGFANMMYCDLEVALECSGIALKSCRTLMTRWVDLSTLFHLVRQP